MKRGDVWTASGGTYGFATHEPRGMRCPAAGFISASDNPEAFGQARSAEAQAWLSSCSIPAIARRLMRATRVGWILAYGRAAPGLSAVSAAFVVPQFRFCRHSGLAISRSLAFCFLPMSAIASLF